jgi:hypothetical protein
MKTTGKYSFSSETNRLHITESLIFTFTAKTGRSRVTPILSLLRKVLQKTLGKVRNNTILLSIHSNISQIGSEITGFFYTNRMRLTFK